MLHILNLLLKPRMNETAWRNTQSQTFQLISVWSLGTSFSDSVQERADTSLPILIAPADQWSSHHFNVAYWLCHISPSLLSLSIMLRYSWSADNWRSSRLPWSMTSSCVMSVSLWLLFNPPAGTCEWCCDPSSWSPAKKSFS